MSVMMACGHAANATNANGDPVCVICVGIIPGAEIVDDQPDLTGRVAQCGSCSRERPSSANLAFFRHTPHLAYDSYYCGCFGWD